MISNNENYAYLSRRLNKIWLLFEDSKIIQAAGGEVALDYLSEIDRAIIISNFKAKEYTRIRLIQEKQNQIEILNQEILDLERK